MADTIKIQEAAKWLARLAAVDGVVSPRERQILKEFADTYGVDVKYLYRYAFAIAHEVAEPEVEYLNPSEYKGRKFEEFVVSLCADKSRFHLLAWRGDKIVDGFVFVRSGQYWNTDNRFDILRDILTAEPFNFTIETIE